VPAGVLRVLLAAACRRMPGGTAATFCAKVMVAGRAPYRFAGGA